MVRSRLAIGVLAVALAAPAGAQNMYVYPQKGQSPDQQKRDESECNGWAMTQTGYNPMAAPTQPAPPPAQAPVGGVVRGGARGAAVGAVAGAIAGDAGKGAAIGAASGGLVGGMRRMDQNRQNAHQSQQQVEMAQQQEASQREELRRAYSACLEGRGYTVR